SVLPQLFVRESLNARRWTETTPTWDVLHTYPHDYKVIFVGDATMSPYEIVAPGGSVEHFNEEAGRVWMERIVATYPACIWLNPVPQAEWETDCLDPAGAPASRRAHVSADHRRSGRGHARIGTVSSRTLSPIRGPLSAAGAMHHAGRALRFRQCAG